MIFLPEDRDEFLRNAVNNLKDYTASLLGATQATSAATVTLFSSFLIFIFML
jgi:hypothetical protein